MTATATVATQPMPARRRHGSPSVRAGQVSGTDRVTSVRSSRRAVSVCVATLVFALMASEFCAIILISFSDSLLLSTLASRH